MANIKQKVTISLDPGSLGWIDQLVQRGTNESRSAAIEAALSAYHEKLQDEQLERALAALTPEDIAEGIALAEMGVETWGAELDAMDGGWGSVEGQNAAG